MSLPRLLSISPRPTRPLLWSLGALALSLDAPSFVVAQVAPAPAVVPQVSATPLAQEAMGLGIATGASPAIVPEATGAQRLEAGRARVSAGRVRREGSILTVEGEDGRPAIFESGDVEAGGTRIQAQTVRIDTSPNALTLRASGQVRLERSRVVRRGTRNFGRPVRRDSTGRPIAVAPRPDSPPSTGGGEAGSSRNTATSASTEQAGEPDLRGGEFFRETLVGENLVFDGRTRQGTLDGAQLQLSMFDIAAATIRIEGGGYSASDVVLRPGGLTEREREIYGTPPFSLRARSVSVLSGEPGARQDERHVVVRGAGLYFRNRRLLSVPLQVLAPVGLVALGAARAPSAFSSVPRVSLNSTDRFFLSTRLSLALSGFARPKAGAPPADSTSQKSSGRSTTALNLDLGISGRLGFRGGLSLENRSPLGLLALQARRADIVTTQLTNRIQLNRFPEISFDSPLLPVLRLGASRGVGAFVSGSAGRLSERIIGLDSPRVESSRLSATVGLTTRLEQRDGLYADLFATRSSYSLHSLAYTNTGFEVGYLGRLLPHVRGLFSLRRTSLGGATPFRFDLIEIPRELRTTFDIEATPRFLIPIDLRYDLDRRTLRDKSVGVLRNYKTFAYGVVYQAARRDLRLELRSSF